MTTTIACSPPPEMIHKGLNQLDDRERPWAVSCVMSISVILDSKLDDWGYLLKRETGSQRYLSCIMQC